MWYWGAHGLDYLGDVIVVGGDPKTCARLGYRAATHVPRRARDGEARPSAARPSITLLPRAAARDRGRALRGSMSGSRDETPRRRQGLALGPPHDDPAARRAARRPPKDESGSRPTGPGPRPGIAARHAILDVGSCRRSSGTRRRPRSSASTTSKGVKGPVMFISNHSSHLDATIILITLPDVWREKTAVGAAKDYFFDVWWRSAFTALVYGGFPSSAAPASARRRQGEGADRATAGTSSCSPRAPVRRTAGSSGSATGRHASRST